MPFQPFMGTLRIALEKKKRFMALEISMVSLCRLSLLLAQLHLVVLGRKGCRPTLPLIGRHSAVPIVGGKVPGTPLCVYAYTRVNVGVHHPPFTSPFNIAVPIWAKNSRT